MPKGTNRILVLVLFTLGLMAAAYALRTLSGLLFVHPNIYYIIVFFFFLSLLLTVLTNFALQQEPQKFVVSYLTSMIIRLLLSFTAILIILFQDLTDKLNFIINFAVVYLSFLVFEIYTLLTTLRPNSEKGIDHVNKKT